MIDTDLNNNYLRVKGIFRMFLFVG